MLFHLGHSQHWFKWDIQCYTILYSTKHKDLIRIIIHLMLFQLTHSCYKWRAPWLVGYYNSIQKDSVGVSSNDSHSPFTLMFGFLFSMFYIKENKHRVNIWIALCNYNTLSPPPHALLPWLLHYYWLDHQLFDFCHSFWMTLHVIYQREDSIVHLNRLVLLPSSRLLTWLLHD